MIATHRRKQSHWRTDPTLLSDRLLIDREFSFQQMRILDNKTIRRAHKQGILVQWLTRLTSLSGLYTPQDSLIRYSSIIIG